MYQENIQYRVYNILCNVNRPSQNGKFEKDVLSHTFLNLF